MFIRSHKGFTLIELIMVITILGILAVVAIPRFVDLRADAKNAAARGIQAAGEAGAQLWRAKFLINSTVAPYITQYPGNSADCFDTAPTTTEWEQYTTVAYDSTTGRWTVTP